jgi:uracil-DNA glycosylase family 4
VQPKGEGASPSKRSPAVPTTEDQIKEKYLERAIRELNQLTHRLQECQGCARGNLMPVLGSGHPQADVMLLKYAPSAAEIEEGVAYYGRAGTAIMKSLKRLAVDPLAVYGTLCVKCPLADPSAAEPECVARVVEEIAIIEPRCIVVMGEAALDCLNDVQIPLARTVEPLPGQVQRLTPSIDVIFTPDIDGSLDAEEPKQDFWRAFRALGDWYADLPPY